MVATSIPVDLFNPGQILACMGFLEAADYLLSDAEARFDWSDEADVRFDLRAAGEDDPFTVVLEFLSRACVLSLAPKGYTIPPGKRKTKKSGLSPQEKDEDGDRSSARKLELSDTFPGKEVDRMALPVRLRDGATSLADLTHWADGSSRNGFKLYAGNRSAYDIVRAMLRGTRKKPTKKNPGGEIITLGVSALYESDSEKLAASPFDVTTRMGGSFNFDPRGAWTPLDAGYSPNQQQHWVTASPVVEILAVWGLEHARPDEYETRRVRYSVWSDFLPPILVRPLLGCGAIPGISARRFRFELDLSGKNKVVTYAQEEISA